ncbi:Uncharacterized protein OS=Sorangium cellulosum (strain So ce56) GN=sce5710 PE=4 SV=1 [Gemmata massiliana]|uniref:SMI1/KNR4 family protein n=2 Tax=Gemmata massiliana TaxID=1210884 RepID=A0A6P2DH69_9BACT|nr:Uncharacterized protein OS=Sorangium cellulosum (strain So ce56) GN=sce5710 PE=4 SV=1 [Gemmata massiliana]
MNEQMWLTDDGDDFLRLVKFAASKVSERKVRLFSVGSCRLIWTLITKKPYRVAVETAEAFADGEATKKALTAARIAARTTAEAEKKYAKLQVAAACLDAVDANVVSGAFGASVDVPSAALYRGTDDWDYDAAKRTVLAFLRDVVGPWPFRKVVLKPSWRTSTVLALASQMYESRDFGAIPILGDALQDAGCDNAEVLDHCRGPGPHVRGCWVVDLVLNKE